MILPQRVLSSLPTSNWVLSVQTQAPGKHSVLHSPLELRNKWSECVIVHDWQQNSLWCILVNSTCVSILAVINNKRHGRRNQSNWMICMWTIRYFAVLVEMNAFIQQQQKKKLLVLLWFNLSCFFTFLQGGTAVSASPVLIIIELVDECWCWETYSGCCSPRSRAVTPREGERRRETARGGRVEWINQQMSFLISQQHCDAI